MRSLQKHSKKFLSILSVLTLMLTMVCSLGVSAEDTETQTNLVSTATKFQYMGVSVPDGLIWDDTYNYGTVTWSWYSKDYYPAKLCDGDTNNIAYASVLDNGSTTDVSTVTRKLFWMDLGAVYNLTDINLYNTSLQHGVYDFSVYGSFTAVNDCSTDYNCSVAATAMLTEENKIGHYKSTQISKDSFLELPVGTYARYLMIVVNKMYTDYGNANDPDYAGEFGSDPLPGAADGSRGKHSFAELEVLGEQATNLLTSGTAFTAYSIPTNDKLIWDDTYNYGSTLTGTSHDSALYPALFSDGDLATSYTGGYNNNWTADDYGSSRRVAFWFDLGKLYRLDQVSLHVPSVDYFVYDYFVYASANDSTAATAFKDENRIGHFKTETRSTASTLKIESNELVRYVLIVFNKLANDIGNGNAATSGQYGANPLPGAAYGTGGGIYVSEIEILGKAPVSLLTPEKVTAGTQSFKSYAVPNPTGAKLWDLNYPTTYGTAVDHYTAYTMGNGYDDKLVDGDTSTHAWQAWGLDGKAGYRLVHWIDLGELKSLDSMIVYTRSVKTSVYDYSVYGSATVSDIDALLEVGNVIGRYTSDQQHPAAITALDDITPVRYLAVVFNKLATDPGNSNDTSATASDYYDNAANRLPGGEYVNGSLHLSEIQVFGETADEVSAAPKTEGATVSVDPTNGFDMKFVSKLPTNLTAAAGYTLKEYGTLVIPYQYLPISGSANAKDDAQLVYGNQYVATAANDATEVAPVAGAAIDVELSNSATVYPGVKFAVRTFMLYEDAAGNQEIVYGNMCVRSVWNVARSIATAVLKAKEAGTLTATLTYTEKVTDAYTAALAAVATSSTDVTYADLYDFISKNVKAVEEIA
ncbi:MAG: hypothetical protein IJP14_04785 [Clostridia bacterium]|nr:hypothetical protein [Clostridia bacterium]